MLACNKKGTSAKSEEPPRKIPPAKKPKIKLKQTTTK
jgi:hypothetical protein